MKSVSRKPDSSLSPQFPRKFIVINYSENSFDTSVHKLEYQETDFEWMQIIIGDIIHTIASNNGLFKRYTSK